MRTWMIRLTAVAMAAAVALGGGLSAEDGAAPGGGPGKGRGGGRGNGPGAEFRKEQHQKRKAHMEEQRAEWKALRETLKDKEPAEIVSAIKALCVSNHSENQAFADEMHAARVAFVKEMLSERGVDAGKQAEILNELDAAYKEHMAHRAAQHEENVAALDELAGKEDLTKEDIKTTLAGHRKAQREENKAFREERRAEHRKRREERRQNRGRQGGGGQGGPSVAVE